MKKKILIISGGISNEREISLETGKQVSIELLKNNYKVKIVEPNYKLSEVIKKFKPKSAILTHLGAWLFYYELKKLCPKNVEPWYDGLTKYLT